MTKKAVFYPQGVCSQRYEITITDGIVEDIVIEGGCNGNLQGIRALVIGRKAAQVAETLQGIRCGLKNTSCPDQISRAIREML